MRIDMTKYSAKRSALATVMAIAALAPTGIHTLLAKLGVAQELTYNYRGGYPAGTNTGVPGIPVNMSIANIRLDFAKIAVDRAAAGQAALGAADVLELFAVPAGVWVPAAFIQTTKVEGAAATFDLGDGVTPAGFISNADGNALGWAHSLVTTTYSLATAGGKLYTAADSIDLVIDSAATDACVLQILVAMVDLTSYRS